MIAGPAIGGALIAAAGVGSAFVFDALTYVFSFLAVRLIRSVPPPEASEPPSVAGIVEGFRCARSRSELTGTYVVDFVAMVFGMPLALFPAMSEMLGGPKALGPLYAAPAVGALAASLTSRWTPRVHRQGLAVMLAATVWGVCDRWRRRLPTPWARARLPRAGRRGRRREWDLPLDDVESNDS